MKCILQCNYQHTLTNSLPRDLRVQTCQSYKLYCVFQCKQSTRTDNYISQRPSGYRQANVQAYNCIAYSNVNHQHALATTLPRDYQGTGGLLSWCLFLVSRKKKKDKRHRRVNQQSLTVEELLESPTFKKFSASMEYILEASEDTNFGSLDTSESTPINLLYNAYSVLTNTYLVQFIFVH